MDRISRAGRCKCSRNPQRRSVYQTSVMSSQHVTCDVTYVMTSLARLLRAGNCGHATPKLSLNRVMGCCYLRYSWLNVKQKEMTRVILFVACKKMFASKRISILRPYRYLQNSFTCDSSMQ